MSLNGEFTPPGDKSISHRMILMAILGEGETSISGLSDCEDVKTSLNIFRSLGGQVKGSGASWTIKGLGGKLDASKKYDLYCGNSGTTLRLLSGILAGIPGDYILDGDSQLRRRPMERVADPLRQMGAKVKTTDGHSPVDIHGGPLHGITYNNQDGSAQLKSAVMLASLSASSPSTVIEKIPTRAHTEQMINAFGGRVVVEDSKIEISPGLLHLPKTFVTPADPSSAAFFLTGAAFMANSRVTAKNMLLSFGRIGFLKVLDRMGATINISMEQEKPEPSGQVTVAYNGQLQATEVLADEIPSIIDEIPILALAAAFAKGTTVFRNVRELRLKETDRLTAIKYQLGALGIRVKVDHDDLLIEGPSSLFIPETLDSGHDHRLAMMLYIALLAAQAQRPVLGDESIAISYPGFKKDLAQLSAV